jgi:hypothetical protein
MIENQFKAAMYSTSLSSNLKIWTVPSQQISQAVAVQLNRKESELCRPVQRAGSKRLVAKSSGAVLTAPRRLVIDVASSASSAPTLKALRLVKRRTRVLKLRLHVTGKILLHLHMISDIWQTPIRMLGWRQRRPP